MRRETPFEVLNISAAVIYEDLMSDICYIVVAFCFSPCFCGGWVFVMNVSVCIFSMVKEYL